MRMYSVSGRRVSGVVETCLVSERGVVLKLRGINLRGG